MILCASNQNHNSKKIDRRISCREKEMLHISSQWIVNRFYGWSRCRGRGHRQKRGQDGNRCSVCQSSQIYCDNRRFLWSRELWDVWQGLQVKFLIENSWNCRLHGIWSKQKAIKKLNTLQILDNFFFSPFPSLTFNQ